MAELRQASMMRFKQKSFVQLKSKFNVDDMYDGVSQWKGIPEEAYNYRMKQDKPNQLIGESDTEE